MAKRTASSHACDKAPQLAVLQKQVNDLDHTVNGNGKKGLRDDVIVLTEVTNSLIEGTEGLRKDLNDFRTVLAGINIYMAERDQERKDREEATKREKEIQQKKTEAQRWIIGVLLVIAVILFGNGWFKKDIIYPKLEKIGPNTYIQTRTGQWELVDSAYYSDTAKPK